MVSGMSTPILGHEPFRRNRNGVEAPRNSFDHLSASARWISAGYEDIPFSFEVPARPTGRKPNVVARLMGLDTLPVETGLSSSLHGVTAEQFMSLQPSSRDSFLCFLRKHDCNRGCPSRIVVLKPKPKKTESESQTKTSTYPPEKVLHAVAETITQRRSFAKDVVQERLRTGSRNAREIAQGIAMQAREMATRRMQPLVHAAKDVKQRLEDQSGCAPTLNRYINLHRGLEAVILPTSPGSSRTCEQQSPTTSECTPEKQPPKGNVEKREQPSPVSVFEFTESESPRELQLQDESQSARVLDFGSQWNNHGLNFLTCRDQSQRADMNYIWRVISHLESHWRTGSRIGATVFHRLDHHQGGSESSRLHRRLLFDTVAEMLSRKRRTAGLSRQTLMREVWSEVTEMENVATESMESISRRDVCSGVFWLGLEEELDKVRAELDGDIIDSLVDETARELLQG